MSGDTKMTGGCMCGGVRYETTGKSFGVIHCHCQSCRKHNGAAVVTLAGFKADQVAFSGDERKIYESSPGVGRAFCGKCGTPLTWEGDGGDLGPIVEFHISTFDDPDVLVPTAHAFDPERISCSRAESPWRMRTKATSGVATGKDGPQRSELRPMADRR